jgi:hypothetical protein
LILRLIFRFSSIPQTPLLPKLLSQSALMKMTTISNSLAPSSHPTVSPTSGRPSSEGEGSRRRSRRKGRPWRKRRRKISCRRWMTRFER